MWPKSPLDMDLSLFYGNFTGILGYRDVDDVEKKRANSSQNSSTAGELYGDQVAAQKSLLMEGSLHASVIAW